MPWPPPMQRVTTAPAKSITLQRVQQPRRQHGTGGPDRMPVRDSAAVDVDHVLGEPDLAQAGQGDGGEGLVDLDTIDIADRPAGPVEGPLDGRDRTEAEHPRLHSADAVGNQTAHWLQVVAVGELAVTDQHRGGAAVQSRVHCLR